MRRTSPLPFIVLVEFRSARGLLAALLTAVLLGLLCGPRDARAQHSAPGKIAADLKRVIDTRTATQAPWARDAAGTRYVKALIVSSSADPELADLRAHVLAAGGSVYHRYVAVPALSVMLPAHRIGEIAARADVQSVSPNRPAARTASALELATGATSVRAAGVGAASGLDGSGIGIAVLDSGVDPDHHGLRNASLQRSRIVRATSASYQVTCAIRSLTDIPSITVVSSIRSRGTEAITLSHSAHARSMISTILACVIG